MSETTFVESDLIYIYEFKLYPIERKYNFHKLIDSELEVSEFLNPPILLILGQPQSGKTTFIKKFMNCDYKKSRENIRSKYNIIRYAKINKIIPGSVLTSNKGEAFKPLESFGKNFLSKLDCYELNNSLLENITIIDTPTERYSNTDNKDVISCNEIINWFAKKASLILYFIDSNDSQSIDLNLISNMFLKHEEKFRFVLNKCDNYNEQELFRIYGSTLWMLTQSINSLTIPKVYFGYFGCEHYFATNKTMSKIDYSYGLKKEINNLTKTDVMRKIKSFVSRTNLVLINALIVSQIRKQNGISIMKSRKNKIIESLEKIFRLVASENSISLEMFPNVDVYAERLKQLDFSLFQKINEMDIQVVRSILDSDITILLKKINTLSIFDEIREMNPDLL